MEEVVVTVEFEYGVVVVDEFPGAEQEPVTVTVLVTVIAATFGNASTAGRARSTTAIDDANCIVAKRLTKCRIKLFYGGLTR